MKLAAIIPARLDSTRFPRKLLQELDGLPIIAHVARSVSLCPRISETWVATGDPEIADRLTKLGILVFETTRDLPSGTDRIAEANDVIRADVIVNIQGDEPLVEPTHVSALLDALDRDPESAASTLRHELDGALAGEPNVVKVVVDARMRALYFSRHPLAQSPGVYFKHLGMYAYRQATLDLFRKLPPSPQERAERLEQLRLLNAGLRIAVADTTSDTLAVDVPEDLDRVRQAYRARIDNAASLSID